MNRCKSLYILVAFIGLSHTFYAQVTNSDVELPKVFQIGDFTEDYEKLYLSHINLLEVCDDNMQFAYDQWLHMLNKMDDMSGELGVDLKGVKLWLNVFWNKDGVINHLVYRPKPNSKNLDDATLSAFFKNFVKHYQLPIKADQSFTHYGGAAFPTLSSRLAMKNQKN